MERESCIKDYKSLKKGNLKSRNLKIISLKSKGRTKDFKRGKYLSELYNRNSGVKMEFI